MTANRAQPPAGSGGFLRALLTRLRDCRNAAVAPMFALLLIPIAGTIAYAVELGGILYYQRAVQNAADAAALAAATNNSESGTTFLMEARAAARPFGFVDGVNGVAVNAAKLGSCPPGTPGVTPVCYEATVSTSFPLTFSRMIGFGGTDGSGSQLVSSRAVANAAGGGGSGTPNPACLWALGDISETLSGSGIPFADLSGCGVLSAGSIQCVGNTMEADYALAAGPSSEGCAGDPENDIDPSHDLFDSIEFPEDPYSALVPPANPGAPCGSTPSEKTISGDLTNTFYYYCGDVKLTGNVNLTGTGTRFVIDNGTLNLNGHTIRTLGESATATIIFTGDNTAKKQHYPTAAPKAGTVTIKAPTEGYWADIALFQDPNLINSKIKGNDYTVNFTYAGNNPTWNIAGVAYFPGAALEFKGIPGKYEDNLSCFVLMAYSIAINGTGVIAADNTTEDCESSGYGIPGVDFGGTTRPKLVL